MCGSERFIIIKQVLTQSSFSRIIFRTNYIGSWFSRNNFLANNKNRRTKLVKIVSIESVLCSASHKILWSQRICTPPFGTTNLRNPYHYKAWKKNWNVIILQSSLCRQYFEPPSLTTHKHVHMVYMKHEKIVCKYQMDSCNCSLLSVDAWIMVDMYAGLGSRMPLSCLRFIIIFLSFLIKSDANLILLDFHFFLSFLFVPLRCAHSMAVFISSQMERFFVACPNWRKWWIHELAFGINRSASCRGNEHNEIVMPFIIACTCSVKSNETRKKHEKNLNKKRDKSESVHMLVIFFKCLPLAVAVMTTTFNAFDAKNAHARTHASQYVNTAIDCCLFVYAYRMKIAAHDMFHIN